MNTLADLYSAYVTARSNAWAVADGLHWKTRAELYANPDYQAAVAAEHDAYVAWQNASEAAN